MLTSNRVDLIDNKVPFGFSIDSSTGEYGYVKQGQSTVTSFGGSGTEITLNSSVLDSMQLKSFKQYYSITIGTQFGESYGSTGKNWYQEYNNYSNCPVLYNGRIYGCIGNANNSSIYTSLVRTLDNMDYGSGKLWKNTGHSGSPYGLTYAACDDAFYYLSTSGDTVFVYKMALDDSATRVVSPPLSEVQAAIGYQSDLHVFGYNGDYVHYVYANETWSIADNLPERQYGLCIKFHNRFYIGTNPGNLYAYYPATSTYTFIVNGYGGARFGPMEFSTWNDKLYIRFQDTSSYVPSTYQVNDNDSIERIDSPSKPMKASGGVIIKNQLVQFSSDSMQIYDPETDSWTDPSIEMLMIYDDTAL